MILSEQFFAAIAGHGTELIVDVGDPAAQIGLGKIAAASTALRYFSSMSQARFG